MSLALALKYRPKSFEDLIGQHAVSQTLSLALDSQHISHAYLFSGLRGSGKTSSARIFARSLQCEKGPTSKPCGECENCKAALEGRHLDIIEMDAASNRKIDDIRDLIEATKYQPAFGRFKIFIIDEVHMLTKEAFNALLKTLEEPPGYVKFILATTDPLKLPATILSRTQHFRFKQIPQKLVIEHLVNILEKENISYQIQALEIIARSGAGSLRDTLTLLDQAIIFCKKSIDVISVSDMLGIVDPQIFETLFTQLLQIPDNLDLTAHIQTLQEYECEMVLDEMMLFLKDRLIHNDKRFSPVLLDRFFRILVDSKTLLSLNTDGSFVLLLSLLKMREALKVKEIESMIQDLESEIFVKQNTQSKAPTTKNTQTHSVYHSHIQPQESISPHPVTQGEALFVKLKNAIYDRNYELGECFSKNIEFVSFANNVLSWKTSAQGDCKQMLSQGFAFIKNKITEIFGEGVSIESTKVPQNTQTDSQLKQPIQEPTIREESAITQEPTIAEESAQDNLASVKASPSQDQQNMQENDKAFIERNKSLISGIQEYLGLKDVIRS
ncbi:MAG: DNA polymerase III subunit gamma/tau [Helicobacter sp.]|nr:DNA polymerase III subunit gamma/tau [Helicobacter sp.]